MPQIQTPLSARISQANQDLPISFSDLQRAEDNVGPGPLALPDTG